MSVFTQSNTNVFKKLKRFMLLKYSHRKKQNQFHYELNSFLRTKNLFSNNVFQNTKMLKACLNQLYTQITR